MKRVKILCKCMPFAKALFAFFVLNFLFTISAFSQDSDVLVKKAGTFKGMVDGKSVTADVRFQKMDNDFKVVTGNEDFVMTIIWNKVGGGAGIKPGTYTFSAAGKDITGAYVSTNDEMPYLIKDGSVVITENDGRTLRGTINLNLMAGGVPIELGGKEVKVKDGTFSITYD
jgi:hypothetical protein